MYGAFSKGLMQSTLLIVLLLAADKVVYAEILIRTDFNRAKAWHKDYRINEKWPAIAAFATDPDIIAKVSWGFFGTIDVANVRTPSEGLKLDIQKPANISQWTSSIQSGLLPLRNSETNLSKLSFSFDHWVNSLRPVVVLIESFNETKQRTGALEITVYPASAKHFMRSAFELSDMKPVGGGRFNPGAAYVQFSFSISNSLLSDGPEAEEHTLRIDNVMFASPAYYVSAKGKDTNDGHTEQTAFASPQKALDVAKGGDIILMMEGSYTGAKNAKAVAAFKHAGYPSAWITLKNYPGQMPVILSHGMDGIHIAWDDDSTTRESPLFSYLEVRGVHIKGNADVVPKLFPAEMGYGTKNTETRGIYISGNNGPTRMYHHIRVADCIIELCGTDGMWASEVDYLTVENNIIRNNCWTTVGFAMAGFSLMMYADFDKTDNLTKIVIRNNQVYGNQRKVAKMEGEPKWFNGNGMLFDANREEYLDPDFYLGRTLIQNNLVYGNGGGGIQNWGSHRLDIVNNTIYHNGITPELKWGNIGLDFCKDVRIVNNIVVALPDCPLDTWMVNRVDKNTSNIVRINNLFFGGAAPNLPGYGDIVADPMFVNPSLDPKVADFRLKPGSPAIGKGVVLDQSLPYIDLSSKERFSNAATINIGAFE